MHIIHPDRSRGSLAGGPLVLLLLLALAGLLTACAGQTPKTVTSLVEPAPSAGPTHLPGASQPRVALVMKTLTNPFFAEMERGARQAEAELGVDLIVKTAAQETSIDQQIAIIERLIIDQVDAIVVAPGDSTSLVPVLKRAQDAGIVIVNVDNRLDPTLVRELGLVDMPFISVDNEEGAYLAARKLSQALTTPAEVLILEGIPTAQNALDRTRGALRAFGESPGITIAAIETAHWKIDEAYTLTRDLLDTYPQVDAIFCANDMMALGSIQYLGEAGRGDIKVVGFDALAEARQAIDAGRLLATIDQQAARQGYLGVQYAFRRLAGEVLPAETMVPVELITAP